MEERHRPLRQVRPSAASQTQRRVQRVRPVPAAQAETGNGVSDLHQLRPERKLGQLSEPLGPRSSLEGRRREEDLRTEAVRQSGGGSADPEPDLPRPPPTFESSRLRRRRRIPALRRSERVTTLEAGRRHSAVDRR